MKRLLGLAVVLSLLLTLPVGCRKEQPEKPVEKEKLSLETLTVEISKGGVDADTLMKAVQQLPEVLKTAFAKTDVEIDTIRVTVGASPADTVQALTEGRVQLAFLPAEGYLAADGQTPVLFADAMEDENGLSAGTVSLLCAAPTKYGGRLAERASTGKPLSWQELQHAHWGVLEPSSLGGYRGFDLWLADEYQGHRAAELPQLTVYNSYESMFRAAAAGEIDALVIRDDARAEAADSWTLDAAATEEQSGMQGFGRKENIQEELPVLDVTQRLYSQIVTTADQELLRDDRFVTALETALETLAAEEPERMAILGSAHFAPVSDGGLDAMRRLILLG